MPIRLVQYVAADGARAVAALDDNGGARRLHDVSTTCELARLALRERKTLERVAVARRSSEPVDVIAALAEGRVLPPIDHPDSAHLHLTGTGLTHLGSAESRDKMHKAAAAGATTDS